MADDLADGPQRRKLDKRYLAVSLVGVVALVLAGVLVVRGMIGSTLEDGTPIPVSGPSAQVEAGGLILSMRISSGPYFLGELIAADLRLENHSPFIYAMVGASGASPCGALQARVMGGVPSQRLYPSGAWSYCPLIVTQLHPGEVWTRHQAIALDVSGWAHIEADANVMGSMRDGQLPDRYANPLFGDAAPRILANIAPHAPANRQLTLRAADKTVSVVLPPAAGTHPYYGDLVTCDEPHGPGSTQMSSDGLYEATTTTFTEPGCPGIHEVWRYWVGAVGYEVTEGRYPATAPAVSR